MKFKVGQIFSIKDSDQFLMLSKVTKAHVYYTYFNASNKYESEFTREIYNFEYEVVTSVLRLLSPLERLFCGI